MQSCVNPVYATLSLITNKQTISCCGSIERTQKVQNLKLHRVSFVSKQASRAAEVFKHEFTCQDFE